MASAQEAFKATHVYQAAAPVAQVMEQMAVVGGMAQRLTDRRRTWGWATGAMFMGMMALFGVAFVSGTPQIALVAGGALVGGIICAVVYGQVKRQCIDERMHGFLVKMLDLVGRDMAGDAPVKVRLDLRRGDDPAKLTGQGKVGDWNVKYFVNPWLSLEGKFLDGTTFDLEMTTRLQVRSKWARTRSGKTKRKTKRKESLRAYLKLWVKPQKYAHLGELGQDAAQAIKLPPQARIRRWNVAPDALEIEAAAGEWDLLPPEKGRPAVSAPHLAAMMFLSLYQILNLSKAIDRARPASKPAGPAEAQQPGKPAEDQA